MLSQTHFYHRITRKMVVAFGTMFNNIRLVRYNKAGTTEIERINVPLQYAQKEKFYQRITQDPQLTKEVQMTLPRMSFELDAITYDPLRKRSSFADSFSPNDGTSVKTVRSTPYNFDFSLSIYVRNIEDGTQIVEQILPYFSPDYTLTVDFVGIPDQKVDVPIILNSVNFSFEDVGSADPLRVLIWTLSFTMKGYMFGPTQTKDIIRTVTANTYNMVDISTTTNRVLTLSNTGTGIFKTGELVYQGRDLNSAESSAFVDGWDDDNYRLYISDIRGIIKTNTNITGVISNASYNVASSNLNDFQLVKIQVTPDPPTANANTAYGFDELIQEFPNIT